MRSFRWKADTPKERAFYLSSLFGFIGLFEGFAGAGAVGLAGLFFARLGFGAGAAGLLAGAGGFFALASRPAADSLPERMKGSRIPPFLGYASLAAVPLLASARGLFSVFALVIVYGAGSALRRAYRRTLLARTDAVLGSSLGRSLHRTMRGLGAVAGCLLLVLLLYLAETGGKGEPLKEAYAFLWFPSGLALLGFALSYKLGADFFFTAGREDAPIPNEDLRRRRKLFGAAFFFFQAGLGFTNPVLLGQRLGADSDLPSWGILLAFAAGLSACFASSRLAKTAQKKIGNGLLLVLPPAAFGMLFLSFAEGPAPLFAFPVWGIAFAVTRTVLAFGNMVPEGPVLPIQLGIGFAAGSACIGFLSEHSSEAVFVYFAAAEGAALAMLVLRRLSGRRKRASR